MLVVVVGEKEFQVYEFVWFQDYHNNSKEKKKLL